MKFFKEKILPVLYYIYSFIVLTYILIQSTAIVKTVGFSLFYLYCIGISLFLTFIIHIGMMVVVILNIVEKMKKTISVLDNATVTKNIKMVTERSIRAEKNKEIINIIEVYGYSIFDWIRFIDNDLKNEVKKINISCSLLVLSDLDMDNFNKELDKLGICFINSKGYFIFSRRNSNKNICSGECK